MLGRSRSVWSSRAIFVSCTPGLGMPRMAIHGGEPTLIRLPVIFHFVENPFRDRPGDFARQASRKHVALHLQLREPDSRALQLVLPHASSRSRLVVSFFSSFIVATRELDCFVAELVIGRASARTAGPRNGGERPVCRLYLKIVSRGSAGPEDHDEDIEQKAGDIGRRAICR